MSIKTIVLGSIMLVSLASSLQASQSVITETEGSACMGDDKSRKDTELLAHKDATRRAAEYAATYVKSESVVKDSALESDIVSAYANAKVSVIQELEKAWYKDQSSGECFKVKLKVEVTPDQKAITKIAGNAAPDDPTAQLNVQVWTDKKEYNKGQQVKLYLKANRPFYCRVVYKDSEGTQVQLLPNPYRKENYFNGGVIYELPGNGDRFGLEVSPPFGKESVTVYASTAPLGDIETTVSGSVYEIKSKPQDVAAGTRGIKLTAKRSDLTSVPPAAEFAEAEVEVRTAK